MNNSELIQRFIDKSIEAFVLGLETFNKPTIRYRIEGFSFFICNAWKLMLKAKLLTDGVSIYYKKQPGRTLGLSDVISRVYTDRKQPLRRNLEQILTLRNTSTHFITEDYETVYAPLFQACVLNYDRELNRFFQRRISECVAQNFLTLSATMEPLTNEQIEIKYPPEIVARLIFQKNDIDITSENTESEQFSIPIKYNLYVTRHPDSADLSVKIDKHSETSINIVKQVMNPTETHKFSYQNLCDEINKRLSSRRIDFSYRTGKEQDRIRTTFTTHCLQLFIDQHDMKSDPRFAFRHVVGKSMTFSYSQQAVEFIIGEIEKCTLEIIANLKRAKNQTTPGA